MSRVLTTATLLLLVAPTTADIIFDGSPGTDAPPTTLGPYTMTPFPEDPRPLFEDVTGVPSPLGGELGFGSPMSHRRVGDGWFTWSHGYTGDVYHPGGAYSAQLILPAGTRAFYFYLETGPFSWHTFMATTDDDTCSGSIEVHGDHGATYFGFYSTNVDTIATIDIEGTMTFSVGEFGVAVPEPTTFGLLGLGVLAMRRRLR